MVLEKSADGRSFYRDENTRHNNMIIEKVDGKLIIRNNNPRLNNIFFESNHDLSLYSKFNLLRFKKFLFDQGEIEESNRISQYLGKIISLDDIPQLTPTGTYRINVSLSYLKKTIDSFVEDYQLDLDPDFQRGHVWTEKQRIKFVEFMLQGGAPNPIYFNHTAWQKCSTIGEMVIVDGKQRLTSLLMFMNNEFPVFKDLDPENIGFFSSQFDSLRTDSLVFVVNNLPTRKQVLQWYLEINTGNIAHTEEELSRVEQLLKTE